MLLTISAKKLTKLELIQHVCDKRISQIDAAQALKLSRRQIQILVNLFRNLALKSLFPRSALNQVITNIALF